MWPQCLGVANGITERNLYNVKTAAKAITVSNSR
jgi:hypothetical protein